MLRRNGDHLGDGRIWLMGELYHDARIPTTADKGGDSPGLRGDCPGLYGDRPG